MKKIIILSILVLFLIVFSFIKDRVEAGGVVSSSAFGGKITATKAKEITALENAGYTCTVNGKTIEIRPIKGKTSYFIPQEIKSKTGRSIDSGKYIIGKSEGKEPINCTAPPPEPPVTVNIDKVKIFGTS